jgi:hypothetical protein
MPSLTFQSLPVTLCTNSLTFNNCKLCPHCIYEGVSKSSQTGSLEHQPMAVRECGRYGREQGTSPLSMPSGVALWTLEVAQRPYLSPRVPARLRLQDGRETGAESKHQVLRETWQIWSGDFWNVTTCVWKLCHESCDVFRVARVLQDRQNITRRRRQIMATFHELKTQKCGNNSAAYAWAGPAFSHGTTGAKRTVGAPHS